MPAAPEPRPVRFDPQSTDAMFATILARLDADALARDDFRKGILKRFDDGTARMNAQDTVLAEIKVQTLKTNGRVTALETRWKLVATKIAAGATVLYALGQVLALALEKGWIHLGS
jgi:hypothetical protein